MKRTFLKAILIGLLCVSMPAVMLSSAASAASRLAQNTATPTPTATPTATVAPATPAALRIISIEPTSMRSDEGGTLTILGDGFQSSSVVRLVGVGVLATTFVNTATLTALVPRDLAPANYAVEAINNPTTSATSPTPLTITPAPTPIPPPAPTDAPPPAQYVRPLMTVARYSTTPGTVSQGKAFTVTVIVKNVGDDTAFNIAMTVPSGDFIPSGNAGTLIFPKLKPGESAQFDQALIVKTGIGGGLKSLELKLAYNDRNGGNYSEAAPIGVSVAGGGAAPTPAPKTPQLVVSSYQTDPAILSPGTVFTLFLDINNVGSAEATRLSAVLGGAATSTTSDGTGGTPGGVSGGSGDFATFGPIGSSNVKFIPTAATTETVKIEQRLIVNSTAKSGAYTVKVSLVYDDPKGQRRTDDQVITLLVIQPPALEIGYYRPIDPAFVGQPWPMPVQVANIGRATTQLGKMEVIAPPGVDVQNGSVFVGPLEPGGQFPIDALVTPLEPGRLTLTVNMHYIDDFNEPKVISATLDVEVMPPFEPPPIDPNQPGGPGVPPPQTEESFFDMLVRAFLGLIGLDSGRPTPEAGGPIEGGAPIDAPVPIGP